jgi:hypothetical protein
MARECLSEKWDYFRHTNGLMSKDPAATLFLASKKLGGQN